METQASPVLQPRKLYLPAGIIKRDGTRVVFEIRRIATALARAGQAEHRRDAGGDQRAPPHQPGFRIGNGTGQAVQRQRPSLQHDGQNEPVCLLVC